MENERVAPTKLGRGYWDDAHAARGVGIFLPLS
jgi:hypothetical protein